MTTDHQNLLNRLREREAVARRKEEAGRIERMTAWHQENLRRFLTADQRSEYVLTAVEMESRDA